MTNLQLVLHESFNARPVDVYRDPSGTEMMTRQQIAVMLGISVNAIDQLHRRYRDRLEQFSVTDKLSGADGKQYKTYLYNFKGILEIARYSNSPMADAVVDFVWELADRFRQGKLSHHDSELKSLREENTVLKLKTRVLEEHTDSEPLSYDEAASILAEYMEPPFGPKHLKKWLAKHGIHTFANHKNDQPMRKYVNRGWFVAKIHQYYRSGQLRKEVRYLITWFGFHQMLDLAIKERLLLLPPDDGQPLLFYYEYADDNLPSHQRITG